MRILCYDSFCFDSIWLDMEWNGIALRLYIACCICVFPYFSIVLNSFCFLVYFFVLVQSSSSPSSSSLVVVSCFCMCKFINLVYLDGAPKEQIVKKSNLPIFLLCYGYLSKIFFFVFVFLFLLSSTHECCFFFVFLHELQ